MFTVFFYTLRESLARRMGVVMLALCILVPSFYIYSLNFEKAADGTLLVTMGRAKVTAEAFVKFNWNAQLGALAQNLWTFLAIFVAAPLLSTYLEKGWADLLLTKGVSRWKFLVGRMCGATFLFFLMLFFMHGIPTLYFGWKAGISPMPFLKALGFVWFGFFCLVSIMALVGVAQSNVALLVMVGFLQIFISRMLVNRDEMLEFFNVRWLKPALDLLHAVLPRTKELADIAADVLNNQTVASWSPLWWSVGLSLGYTVAACYFLHRKAI